MSEEKVSTRGRKRTLTDSERNRNISAVSSKWDKCKIYVRDQLDRWNELKEELRTQSHAEMANILLDRVLTHYRSCLNKNFPKDGCLATVVSVKHPLVNLITASCDTHKSDIVGVLNCFNEKPKVQAKFLTCGSTVASAFKEGYYKDKCKAVDDALSCLKEFDSCAPCHTERLLKAIEKSKEDRCNVVHFVDLQFTG